MYLKQLNEVTRAALPSLIMSSEQEISETVLVKGAATEASALDNDMPTSAAFNAPQSLLPSPTKPT